jgi:hypothetical protein
MRLGLMVLALAGLIGVVAVSATWQADAQGDDSDLRTQVADLQTRVAALETVVASAGIASTAAGETHTITGYFTVRQQGINFLGQCTGSGGYDDIQAGTQVTVRDAGGQIIAVGSLGPGVAHDDMGTPMTSDDPIESPMCVFPILVRDVPDSDFYAIEVSHRGELTFTRAELESLNWEVRFSLG